MRRRTNPVTGSLLPQTYPIDSIANSQVLRVPGRYRVMRKLWMMKSELLRAIAENHLKGNLYPTPYRNDELRQLIAAGLVVLAYDGPRYLGAKLTAAGRQATLGGGHR